ncbi:DUF4397 domain-containing protein [Granulicella mallensis]|jgi:hypothetical protein|uniref:DUF4397 domain-containing protein n=1 Tax=Granulicella mallensis TaxID=940614 RepID=A0A7W7ZVC5_9BACT|nr:DUF4397 domain-containing protein [Granulicella mallensis]MBB5066870.1 hypothetical protein [Granulicella mallensis]
MATTSPHPGRPVPRRSALVLLLAGLGLSGCQSIDINATHAAQVRVIVATPDSPAQDFYQNSSGLAYNLGFGTVTSYVPLPAGAYTLSSAKANTNQTLVSAKATFGSTKQYTVIVGNSLANMQETVLQDQSQPAPAGEVSLRFVQQATHVGPVDVYLIPSGGKLAATSPVATNIDFNSNSGYINVPAGTYAIAVLPAGTTPVPTTVTLHTSTQVTYTSGSARTIVFIDQPVATTPGVQAVVADDYDQ